MKRRALRYGIPFRRAKGFEVPESVFISGRHVRVECPKAQGQKTDFVELFLRDAYCLDVIARERNIQKILDIGANCGWFSMIARAAFPDAAIVAYEPNPIVLPILRHNVAELDVEVNPTAVGATAGWVHMEHPEGETNQARAVAGGDIPRLPIGDVLERIGNVDVMKLDCEGSEWEIIDALPPVSIRWLTMEYHLWAMEGADHSDIRALLGKKNFHVMRQVEGQAVGMLLARRH